MSINIRSTLIALMALAFMGGSSAAFAETLSLDFQPTGGTTAAGYQAFEATNQVIPTAGTSYSAFGSTVTVSVGTANLPDGNLDFRAVARNGAAGDLANDWLGADTRNNGVDVTFFVDVAGLPAGNYDWLSTHHDGGTGATNGNLSGMPDFSFQDATGVSSGILLESSQNDADPIATFSKSFVSDGLSSVRLTMMMDQGQGDTPGNSLFAFVNGVQITQVPEPGSLGMLALGIAALAARRRR